jgi:predicted CxxxxCH...CXXCH cytochrome family protein
MPRALITRALAALTVVTVAACERAQPLASDVRRRVSWQEEIAPLLQERCSSCHSGATPAGGYEVTTYLSAIGAVGRPGRPPVVTAGDASSTLLATLDPAKADAIHQPLAGALPLLSEWVVEGRLSYFRSGVHEGGILNPADPDFHGQLLRDRRWDFALCQSCHGADFTGGKAGVSCTSCHSEPAGPQSCTTCHGQPPDQGAHLAHVGGVGLGKKLACSECHTTPAHWDDPGHLFLTDAAKTQKTRATVLFGALASKAPASPSWDPTSARCSATWCHGGGFTDAKATNPNPVWTGGAGQASCGTCHGLPPANHGSNSSSCSTCHAAVAGPGVSLANPSLHIDGVVQVGDGSGTCSACHGTPGNPAPPRDVAGNTDPSFITVGAHQAHLNASHQISGRIQCSACHVVPQTALSPGHIDHDGPATVTFSGLALADSAQPRWDRATASCSATYCHGGGAQMAADTTPKKTPVWTAGTSQASCGSCHGLPPTSGAHAGLRLGLTDCFKCHADTIDSQGNIIVTGAPGAETSTHLNGVVDVRTP